MTTVTRGHMPPNVKCCYREGCPIADANECNMEDPGIIDKEYSCAIARAFEYEDHLKELNKEDELG